MRVLLSPNQVLTAPMLWSSFSFAREAAPKEKGAITWAQVLRVRVLGSKWDRILLGVRVRVRVMG